ncbi:MAG: phosphoenolpyruvate--protein phosphotransferase [Gammaproteobacteria bacterium]|nr:phosphoenolpyruvate--protein phosphotransferase [Gammaproteobacteria bacterium]MBT8056083.1 phosphoenolpyruvate--protein phosphotransferase [Gammaproteobacteria bacterium]NNJ78001.1 phosphoenolpyruvate--protein phosphotransferase [Xanthomonadales bacterium]
MTLALAGHGVARGIAIGRCHLVIRNELEIGEHRIVASEVEDEIRRYQDAVEAARKQLRELAGRMDRGAAAPAQEILQTHIMMLDDSTLQRNTEEHIRKELCNAEWALQTQLEAVLSEFRNLDDEYIRTRGEDIGQVVRLVQGKLAAEDSDRHLEGIPDRLADTLVIASDLTPSELSALFERGVGGIVTEHGGPHSHAAIMASSLGVPAVLGVRRARSLLREGETLILDGGKGLVYASPDNTIRKHYQEVQAETRRFREALEKIRDLPASSLDGRRVVLMANAERSTEIDQAIQSGADGIGLYRTEFLFMDGGPPDESEQLAHYRSAVEAMDGRPLTIRTLDLGADKLPEVLDFSEPVRNANPALGLRAIRLCLRDSAQFKIQLRAILRASGHGPVRCLVPMITNLEEITKVRSLLDEARAELTHEGLAFDHDLPLGAMIEVPAAALALGELGRHLDFISVGTNDLLQYALAADRVDEQVAHLYELQHPGVLRLMQHIFREAGRMKLPASVCGEAAGDRRYTRLLLALGLRDFSMGPGKLLEVKQVIRNTDIGRATAALTRWLSDPTDHQTPLLEALDASQT